MKYQQIFQNVISPKAAMNRFAVEYANGFQPSKSALYDLCTTLQCATRFLEARTATAPPFPRVRSVLWPTAIPQEYGTFMQRTPHRATGRSGASTSVRGTR